MRRLHRGGLRAIQEVPSRRIRLTRFERMGIVYLMLCGSLMTDAVSVARIPVAKEGRNVSEAWGGSEPDAEWQRSWQSGYPASSGGQAVVASIWFTHEQARGGSWFGVRGAGSRCRSRFTHEASSWGPELSAYGCSWQSGSPTSKLVGVGSTESWKRARGSYWGRGISTCSLVCSTGSILV